MPLGEDKKRISSQTRDGKAGEKDMRESADGLTRQQFSTDFQNSVLFRIEQGMKVGFLCVFSAMLDWSREGDVNFYLPYKQRKEPWLLWLSGLGVIHKLKGCRFDSRSGHMPRLRARSPSWRCARGNQSNVSLLLFLLPFVSKKKIKKYF